MSIAARRMQRAQQSVAVQSVLAQQNTGIWNGASINVTLPSAPSLSSTLLLIIAGNTTVSTPSDWTLRTSQVGFMGHYLYTRASTTSASWTITTAPGAGTWWVGEVTHAVYDTSASSNDTSTAMSYSTPQLTPTAGQRLLISSIASVNGGAVARTVSGWTNGFNEIADLCNPTDDYAMQGVATYATTANGSTAYSTTTTYSASSPGRSAIICSLATGVAGGSSDTTAPSAPTNLLATPDAYSVSLSWTASTDNIAVTGYEYSLDGTSYAPTNSTAVYTIINGLSPTTAYTIYLRAYDVTGNRSNAATINTTTLADTSGGSTIAGLSRIAWEGGPAYWNQFSMAAAAGWNDPSFFPIGIDPAPFSDESEILWDKSLGINTYVGGLSEWVPWSLLAEHDMYYIGNHFDSVYDGQMPANFPNLVGYRLGDETDGIFPDPEDGYAFLEDLIDEYGNRTDGRFMYNNYTQMCVTDAWMPKGRYVNDFTDAVSLDMYWYTIPEASFTNHGAYVSSVGGPANDRRGTSYGAMTRGLRQVDETDGKKQPVWMFIENLYGGPGENEDPTKFVRYITPGELKGAVIGSIIAEARGILWFNSAMNAPAENYPAGNVIRQAQVNPSFYGTPQVEAMGEINNQVASLARIINTQSFVWTFGPNLETMLKGYDDHAYIFAMISNASTPGARTFTLPSGITGTQVEVVDESRNISVSGGAFTDTFAAEYSYHIYKIAL